MSPRPRPSPVDRFDALSVSSAFAVLFGVASVFRPFFGGVTLSLAALSFSAWLGRELGSSARSGDRGRRDRRRLIVAAAVAGWLLFLAPGVVLAAERPLFLGLSVAPAGWLARAPSPFGGM